MVIFEANTVVFWENIVVYGYLVKNTKGGGERGSIKSGVRTPVLTQHLKRRGRFFLGIYSGGFGNYGNIWGKNCGV